VRDDPAHHIEATFSLLFLTVFLSLQLRRQEKGAWRLLAGLAIATTAALAWTDSSKYNFCGLPGSLWRSAATIPRNVRSLALALSGDDFVARQYNREMEYVRAACPLPATRGTVDVYPSDILLVLANRLNWRPRPVIISNLAHTPELSALNVEHLRGANAPDRVLFSIAPVDDRLAPLEDGPSWPELWSRYDIEATLNDRLWLKRSSNPRTYVIRRLVDVVSTFGRRIRVPDAGVHGIWVSIEINPSSAGRAADALFKSPPPYLRAFLNGGEVRGKLPWGMARSGFLLSPLIGDISAFFKFASEQQRDGLSDQVVRELVVTTQSPEDARIFYDPRIVVHFSSITFRAGKAGGE
jgi:hypothetical protein